MPSTAVSFGKFDTVYLFGGTPLMSRVAEALAKRFKVFMFTSPRQAAEVTPVPGVDLEVVEDINAVAWNPDSKGRGGALAIGIGEAWQFGPLIREAFGNSLIDFMSIPYPRYLGGAHDTHAILNEETNWGCCMQMVTANTRPGEVHDGDVLYSVSFPFKWELLQEYYLAFIMSFVERAQIGDSFVAKVPADDPLFYPRLNTIEQGWVDWSWPVEHVHRFIQAFKPPHRGARTHVDGIEVILTESDVAGVCSTHPFHAGLIVEREQDGVVIVSSIGGMIRCRTNVDGLRPGRRMHTSFWRLERAMLYVPDYTPTGDANAP